MALGLPSPRVSFIEAFPLGMPVLTANQRDEADESKPYPRQRIQACHQNQQPKWSHAPFDGRGAEGGRENMENVKRTTEVSSDIGRACEHCGEAIGYSPRTLGISDSINHYIEAHGYRLLHVGTQTTHGSNEKPWHTTVAVLGHDNPPKVMPSATIHVGIDVGQMKIRPED
jgi:hypothetical protein